MAWSLFFRSFVFVLLPQNHKNYGFIGIISSTTIPSNEVEKPCVIASLGPKRQSWSIVQNGKKHLIPDRYTRERLNCDILKSLDKSSEKALVMGYPIESLWNSKPNTGLISLLNNGTGLVMETYRIIRHLTNPSVIFNGDDVLISGRSSKDNKYQKIWWLQNPSSQKYSLFEKDQKVFDDGNINAKTLPVSKIFGEDPRLFILSGNRIFLTICHRFSRKIPELQMAFSELLLRNGTVEVGPMIDIKYKEFASQDQKNWCPFEYNGTMLFITGINPHRVVGLTTDHVWTGYPSDFDPLTVVIPGEEKPASKALSLQAEAVTVSLTAIGNTSWSYGDMRGGSSAVFIGRHRFLSFFHSSNDVHSNSNGTLLKTYVFGAYVFDSRPPFAIKAISKHPVVHESMYSGEWTDLKLSYYHIDYVVFPMSFVIRKGVIYLLYGKQDTEAWVAKINLKSLLGSLETIHSSTLSNAYAAAS